MYIGKRSAVQRKAVDEYLNIMIFRYFFFGKAR